MSRLKPTSYPCRLAWPPRRSRDDASPRNGWPPGRRRGCDYVLGAASIVPCSTSSLDREQIKAYDNPILCGPTGVGKSWVACALRHKACHDNRSVLYQRVPKLFAISPWPPRRALCPQHAQGSTTLGPYPRRAWSRSARRRRPRHDLTRSSKNVTVVAPAASQAKFRSTKGSRTSLTS
jgi:hypothetical protein